MFSGSIQPVFRNTLQEVLHFISWENQVTVQITLSTSLQITGCNAFTFFSTSLKLEVPAE
jgi:hypothetical protein